MSRRPLIPDASYFVTSVSHERKQWFATPHLADIVVEQWRYYEQDYEFHIHTYCVLPDHYHVVLNVGQKKTISQILHAVNSYTATLINGRLGHDRKIKIWQGEPWDEVIRSETMYWQKVAYTLLNPWRAGLVSQPLERYPYSDIGEWLDREGEEFLLDLFSRYKRWIE
jgi:REP element-mobilizing transposase RayT